MKVKEVIIREVDLKILMNQKGIKSIYQLSKISGVNMPYLYRCNSGYIEMNQKNWDKIKTCL